MSSRWSPCNIMNPSFAVPPQAKVLFSSLTILCISESFGLRPSIRVVVFENLLVSRRTTIRASSFSSSPHAQRSSGRPHFLQITAIEYQIFRNSYYYALLCLTRDAQKRNLTLLIIYTR